MDVLIRPMTTYSDTMIRNAVSQTMPEVTFEIKL